MVINLRVENPLKISLNSYVVNYRLISLHIESRLIGNHILSAIVLRRPCQLGTNIKRLDYQESYAQADEDRWSISHAFEISWPCFLSY
jgi:hypothetical protein